MLGFNSDCHIVCYEFGVDGNCKHTVYHYVRLRTCFLGNIHCTAFTWYTQRTKIPKSSFETNIVLGLDILWGIFGTSVLYIWSVFIINNNRSTDNCSNRNNYSCYKLGICCKTDKPTIETNDLRRWVFRGIFHHQSGDRKSLFRINGNHCSGTGNHIPEPYNRDMHRKM